MSLERSLFWRQVENLNPHSIRGNDLRIRRRRQEVQVPVLPTRRAVFDYLGIEDIRPLSLQEGQLLVPARLAQYSAELSPSQPNTPMDGNCLLDSLWDQLK